MAKTLLLTSNTLKAIICCLLLAISLRCANAARILDEVDPEMPLPANAPEASDPTDTDVAPVVAPAAALPSGQIPATGPTTLPIGAGPITTVAPVANIPNTVTAPVATPAATLPSGAAAGATVAPVATPAVTLPSGPAAVATTSATVAPDHPPLSFFMHDILGGSHPSGRVVTGIVANSDVNNLPFSKPNGQVFPINGGVPLNTVNINGIINNNNAPFLVGLNGQQTNTVIQNNGNNNVVNGGNNLPFVSAGQLPAGITLQQLMFGSITVVDNELTEGHELGTAVLGKAQGFYMASSLDGSSHTLVLTALFHGGDHEVDDTISFFGVHRTATPESHIAIVGGTGKYENAKGYAIIVTLHQQDQHTTDGVETITQFSVYLTP
ncbi:unnamed protein product [Ilex paraguariensis]|uniref:Dirigent protein n=1 Tax=Ilex paraguariensis TaxID=185542 RepID=A0ABC8U4Y5_9AQUA